MNKPASRHQDKNALSFREEQSIFKAYSRVCLIVFVGTAVSLILFMLMLGHSMSLLEKDFRHDADSEILSLNHKIQVLDQFWNDIHSFYASSEEVSRPEFKRFTSSMFTSGDMTLIGWIPAENRLDIKPETIFLETKPGIDKEKALEFLVQKEIVATILRQAQTAGGIIVHPVFTPFVRKSSEHTHLAIVVPLPLKEKAGKTEKPRGGFVFALLSIEHFFSDIFSTGGGREQNQNISIHLIEGMDEKKRLLFTRQSNKKFASTAFMEELSQYDPVFSVSRTLAFGSAHLEIKIDPSFSYLSQAAGVGPWAVLVLVMILTGFIAFWFYQLIHRNIIITRAVREKTQALASSERHLQTILDNAVDGIITIDDKGIVQSYNAACERIFGYTAGEVIGNNANMLMPEPYYKKHDSYIANYLKTDEAKTTDIGREVSGRRKDGEVFPIDLSIGEIQNDDGRCFFVGIVRDVTERKQTEEQIRNYMEELKRSNDELDDFVYVVSHDLKEPLRGLYSYAQFLQEDYTDKLDEEGQHKLETLKNLAIRMQDLIDRLLYYSRLGRGDMAFQSTDLNKMLDELLETIEPSFEGRDVKIDFHKNLPVITCDSVRVGEVFRNLIVNAVKYNDKDHKHVEIGCTTQHEKYPEQHVFFVADNGIGIEEKHKEAVFKMFKRLHGRDEYGGGTGAGLTIVKKIIDRHGGDIWIESNVDGGTTFYFTLGAS